VLVPFSDHKVFVDPRDDPIAYTLLAGGQWQRGDIDAAIELAKSAGKLKQQSVFVDVGANIGLITVSAMLSGHFSRAIALNRPPGIGPSLSRISA